MMTHEGLWTRILARLALAGALAVLAGCASGPGAHPRDPLEPFNRDVTKFNEAVDRAVLKPVATTYVDVTPKPLRTGVSNFFGNLTDVWSLVNNVLQFKGMAAADTALRLSVNTLLGLGGVLDIASEMNVERHKQDFGQTLAHYGVPTGPYLVLPILGPSTVRDTLTLPLTRTADPVARVDHVPTRNTLYGVPTIDTRANLLRASQVLDDVALDKYTFTRDAYLKLRDNERRADPDDEGGDSGGRLPPEEP